MITKVDKQAIRFNQASGMVLIIIAFALNQPWLVLLTFLILIVGLLWSELSPFGLLYRKVFLTTGLLEAKIEDDNPAAHRFAAALAAIVLAFSSMLLLWLDIVTVGWALAILVAVLMALSVFAHF
jgi:hypothetical protein